MPSDRTESARPPGPPARAARALDALNLFLADVRDGLGPYLAIYLIAVRGPEHGWDEATVGLVITIAGIVALLAQTPAGALIDRTRHKRAIVAVAAVIITLACLVLPLIEGFAAVALTQALAAAAGAVFAPALAGITLGLVGPKLFARRIGRNEAFNHAGNAAAAMIAAAAAYKFGPLVVFWLMAALALASIVSVMAIPAKAIDDDVARGLDHAAAAAGERVSALSALVADRRLLLFALLMATFHLANAAMLPTVGQLLARLVGAEYATSLIAACIVAAQCVMVPVAMLVGATADRFGSKPIFLVAFAVLAVRGVLYTLSDAPAYILAVQCLDGIGAGIFGALFPIVIADLTRGTGRFNVGQGAVATVQGLGAALSASLAGTVIVGFGYDAAFLVLAAVAAAGFLVYWLAMPETRPAAGPVAAGAGTRPAPVR